jgi:shikimate dehydrogenase
MTEVLQPGGALPGNSFLCGLLGAGIAGSRSPELHETEARALGLPLVYRILDGAVMGYGEAELPRILTMLGQMGFAGVNVTHPFKQAVVPLLDHLSDAARVLGAVNTVVWRPEGLFGDNTDWSGYRAHFLTGLGDKPRETVAMIGAGGAAAAVGFAHLDLGARDLRIVDTAPSGRRLWPRGWARFSRKRASPPARMPPTPWPGLTAWCNLARGHAEPSRPAFRSCLARSAPMGVGHHLFPGTHAASGGSRRAGCATLAGGGMAVLQAAHAFALFTGAQPDAARMLRAFAKAGS